MDRLPTELLYEIVARLSTDHDALAALQATNRKYRDVVFRGWLKPMLIASIGDLLPEAMALHKLPYLSKGDRSHVHDCFMRMYGFCHVRLPMELDQQGGPLYRHRITTPNANTVDDAAFSSLSVRKSLHLVEFHQRQVMRQATMAIKSYEELKVRIAAEHPGAVFTEVSLEEETLAAASMMYRAEHYIRALACATGANQEHSRYFKESLGLEIYGTQIDQQGLLLHFRQMPKRNIRNATDSGDSKDWAVRFLMSGSRMLVYSTPGATMATLQFNLIRENWIAGYDGGFFRKLPAKR